MNRTPSVRGLGVNTVLAVTVLAVGGMIAYRPTLMIETVPELEARLEAMDPGLVVVLLVIGLLAFTPVLGIAGRRRRSSATSLRERSASDPADARSHVLENRLDPVGHSFERDVSLATAYDERSRDEREDARARLVESIRPVAATAYANRAGRTRTEAMTAVEAGTWTDDARAAAFLAGAEGPSLPLSIWVIDLVRTADPFVRSLDRTIEEIDRLQSTPAPEVAA